MNKRGEKWRRIRKIWERIGEDVIEQVEYHWSDKLAVHTERLFPFHCTTFPVFFHCTT